MDINNANGLAAGTLGMTDIPLGFGFALATNEHAMRNYASLGERAFDYALQGCEIQRRDAEDCGFFGK